MIKNQVLTSVLLLQLVISSCSEQHSNSNSKMYDSIIEEHSSTHFPDSISEAPEEALISGDYSKVELEMICLGEKAIWGTNGHDTISISSALEMLKEDKRQFDNNSYQYVINLSGEISYESLDEIIQFGKSEHIVVSQNNLLKVIDK